MRLIAHRGASQLAPENSLAAIVAADRLGVDFIEIDIRLTKDDQFVICHDASLRRLAGRSILVSSTNLKELKQIKLVSGEYLTDLDEVMRNVKTSLMIDAKASGWAKRLAKALKHDAAKSVAVVAFNKTELAHFKKLRPDIKTFAAAHINIFKTLSVAKSAGFDGICLPFFVMNPLIYSLAKRNGLEIGVYTVNSKLVLRALSWLYPSIVITTDAPQKMIRT